MKICFYTEGSPATSIPRTYPGMRTDLAWQCALNAVRRTFPTFNTSEKYDLGIIIVPKKFPERAFNGLELIRYECDKVAVMQEGPNWFWQDWDVANQIAYFNLMHSVDIIYVHNEVDRNYFSGMFGHSNVRILPTLMIEDAIRKEQLCDPQSRTGAMIGGNFVSWYGGFDSFSIATEFEVDIYAPSMGRKQSGESLLDSIEYLPYMPWSDWIVELSKRKYAVHMMRTHAAGTFALNCAYLGIPCIGYKGLDTQEICHPKLSFDVGDMESARRMAKHLRTTPQFYEHCSVYARNAYAKHFDESVFLENFNHAL